MIFTFDRIWNFKNLMACLFFIVSIFGASNISLKKIKHLNNQDWSYLKKK
jgi:hypothetical protein